MKKMKLFTKTFLFTMLLMCMILVISHALLYVMMPQVYVNYKYNEVDELAEKMQEEMKGLHKDEIAAIAQHYVTEVDADISIEIENEVYLYTKFASITTYSSQNEEASIDISEPTIDKQEESLSSSFDPSVHSEITLGSAYRVSGSESIEATKLQRELEIPLADEVLANATITMNLQPVSDASKVMFQILPYTIGISILISLLASYLYTRALTRPIHSICDATKKMEGLEVDAHCHVARKDEIGELAENINSLYDSLQKTIRSLESEITHVSQNEKEKVDFLRSASHELKTPLTSLSVMLENMMLNVGKYKDHETYLSKCKEVVDQLSLMIKEILDASSLEHLHQPEETQPYDLSLWLEENLEPYKTIAKAKGIQMNCIWKSSFSIQINPSLFLKALSNILSNAIQYTESAHAITITLKDHILTIDNECEQIPQEHLQHLTEAFYRPDFSRTKQTGGNGLGLYFVDQIFYQLQIPYNFVSYEAGMRFQIDLSQVEA